METKNNPKNQSKANKVRSDLLQTLNKVGEVELDWKLLRSEELPKLKVEPCLRQAMDLICRRAEMNCFHIVGQIIIGLAALDRGDAAAADHAANLCWRLIRFDEVADDLIDALLADASKEVTRG
jgi:hypothetical protein